VLHATFTGPDLTTFCRLDELGLKVTGQRLDPDRAVLACRVVGTDEADGWCRRCGCEGLPRDTVVRRLAHEPLGWRPTTLLVTIRRYRCAGCGHVWRQDTSKAAEPRAKLSRRGLRGALEGIVCQHLTVARVAEGLAVARNTANDAVLAEGKRVLIDDPGRFDGVNVIGMDEHVWRHTRRGDKYVTVIIDLTPIRDGTGPARLLDMVDGRSSQVFKTWCRCRRGSGHNRGRWSSGAARCWWPGRHRVRAPSGRPRFCSLVDTRAYPMSVPPPMTPRGSESSSSAPRWSRSVSSYALTVRKWVCVDLFDTPSLQHVFRHAGEACRHLIGGLGWGC
jgi:hypothetical protein